MFGQVSVFVALVTTVAARCGSPELPLLAANIGVKDYYEEGETFQVKCIGGTYVHPANHSSNEMICSKGQWLPQSGHCSQVLMWHKSALSYIGSEKKMNISSNLPEHDLLMLTDNNPQTCVMGGEERTWNLNLETPLYISHVALIATNHDLIRNRSIVSITADGGCKLEEHSKGSSLPLLLLVYRCPAREKVSEITIRLAKVGKPVGICDIDLFAIRADSCGLPEKPLYSSVNQMTIQNNTKVSEYNCAEGYKLIGNELRACGQDGNWHPRSAPACVPITTCSFNANLMIHENVTFNYVDLDLDGNAIPGVSWRRYECRNKSLVMETIVGQTCLVDGSWTPLGEMPDCVLKVDYMLYGHYLYRSRLFVAYLLGASVFFLVATTFLMRQTRRTVLRLQQELRDSHYRNSKVLPAHVIDMISGNSQDKEDMKRMQTVAESVAEKY